MGHSKLPWKKDEGRLILLAQNGKKIARFYSVGRKAPLDYDNEQEKEGNDNFNLAFTAVNVMPEVKRILKCITGEVIDNPLRLQTFNGRCEHLLEKLEGVDG